jgi:hypothetical protein
VLARVASNRTGAQGQLQEFPEFLEWIGGIRWLAWRPLTLWWCRGRARRLLSLVAAEYPQDLPFDPGLVGTQVAKHMGQDTRALPGQAEQEMLGADVADTV